MQDILWEATSRINYHKSNEERRFNEEYESVKKSYEDKWFTVVKWWYDWLWCYIYVYWNWLTSIEKLSF